MDAAMFHDARAWSASPSSRRAASSSFCAFPSIPASKGWKRRWRLRFFGRLNRSRCEYVDGKLIYTMEVCRVQAARERKGMPFHPCKGVGVIEYSGFARGIDSRIQCACLSCYPEVTDDTCSCKWAFSIPE